MAKGAITVKIDGQYDNKDIDRAIRDLNRLKDDSGAAKGPMDSLTGAMKGLALGAAAAMSIGAVVDFMKDAATAAIQDEQSMVALAKAMDNVGQGFANTGAEKFIKDLMLATGVADDDLRPAMQRLVTATGDAAKSQQLLQTALDVSAATGKDLVTVSTAISKAATGNIGALTRLGVPIDANIVKTKDFGAAVDVLNQKFGGQAAAAAATYGGQLKRVQTAAAEAQETIGYALLNAIDDVSKSFGFGADGATSMLTAFGDATANFVRGAGMIVSALGGITSALNTTDQESTDWGDNLRNIIIRTLPMLATTAIAIEAVTDAGARQTAVEKAKADEIEGLNALYAGYKANSDRAHSATVALAAAAEEEADALKRVSAAAKELQGILSASAAMDDFKKSLADLDTTLKGNTRTFNGMSDGAKENRDALRTALGDASAIAQKWVEDGKISADQYQAAYRGLAKKAVNQFVTDGFKRSDIQAFLGGEGIWTGTIKATLSATEKAALAAARSAGQGIGEDLAAGVAQGIRLQTAKAAQQTRILVQEAEAAGRAAAESNSPSMLFARMGSDLVAGLVVGMDSKKEAVKQAATDTMQAIYDRAQEITDKWKAQLSTLKDNLASAQQDVAAWAKSTSDSLVSAFDMKAIFEGSYDEAGNFVASKFQSGWTTMMEQFNAYTSVLTSLKASGASDQLLAFIQSQGITTGTSWGTALIDNGLVKYATDNLATVQTTADTTAKAMTPAFLTEAVTQAKALYDEFKLKYGKDGEYRQALEGLMDRLARSLDRTSTITVKTVYEAAGLAGKRAAGGPVSAGQAYLVGEQGPEVLVMGPQSGSIIPNGALGSSSGGGSIGGNSYTINVNTGVGDPRQIGQAIVEYIRKYESANGRAFAPAA